jgi:hypothetical protein
VRRFPWPRDPKLPLGTTGPSFLKLPLRMPLRKAKAHWHIIGTSGSGKSFFLAHLFLQLHRAGIPVTLIDPHGDLAKFLLLHLVAQGVYQHNDAFERILYVDLPAAERQGLFLPFNVLAQNLSSHTIASNIKEAFHRAWPALSGGAAPMFDTLVQDSIKVLVSNKLPLTNLYRFLTDKPFRDHLLANEPDPDIVSFFHDQFDRLAPRDQADQAGSALRRAHLLTFAPVLKYSLGQHGLALNFREILDRGKSTIINLALADAEARRLLGCLFTVMAEQGALSRAELTTQERRHSHFLMIDEFSEFTAQSEEALARMLSQTRKFGLFLVMAHQTWSQASSRLKGALQNVGVDVLFRLGREDAEYSSRAVARFNPHAVKHKVEDAQAEERSHPMFYGLSEQFEGYTQHLQELKPRHFLLKLPGKPARWGKTVGIPTPRVDPAALAAVEQEYLRRYFTPQAVCSQQAASPLAFPALPGRQQRRQPPTGKLIFTRTVTVTVRERLTVTKRPG